jgi:hypothetical protein
MAAASALSIVATTNSPFEFVVGLVQMKRPTARKSARRGYDYSEIKILVSGRITG